MFEPLKQWPMLAIIVIIVVVFALTAVFSWPSIFVLVVSGLTVTIGVLVGLWWANKVLEASRKKQ